MLLMGAEVPLWAVLSTSAVALIIAYKVMFPDPYKNSGLPGPSPLPILGNFLSYANGSVPIMDVEWREKYGKIVLTYDASLPNILVYDPDFIRACFIKQFDKLTDRRVLNSGGAIDSGILNAPGEHWKHVRQSISPTFTSGKLKKMLLTIQNCCKNLVKVLNSETNKPVDVRNKMSAYTVEVIGGTAFGLDVDCQQNPEEEFLKSAQAFVGQFENTSSLKDKIINGLLVFMLLFVPSNLMGKFLKLTGFTLFDKQANDYLEAVCRKMIAENSEVSRDDFIKTVSSQRVKVKLGDPDAQTDRHGNVWTKKGLTEEEIVGNALLFIFAGYQTTSDTSHFLQYELAWHPEVQTKLREEITENCTTDEVTYEQLSKLDYAEWCINEALRLYPAVFRWDREVTEDFECNGIQLKKGSVITVGSMGIHRNPEYWEDPLAFDPDRWCAERSEGRHPCAFVPFGYGPRACIGMRLALLEMKIALVYMMKNFEVKRAPSTPSRPLELRAGFVLLPENPIELEYRPLDS